MIIIGFLMPVFMEPYKLSQYSYYYSMTILALSITLVWGYTGIFSFGQAAFMGVGAYTYGIISQVLRNNALTPLVLLIAVGFVTVIGLVLAYFMFYGGVNDVFVGLITMCVGIALQTFLGQTAGSQWQIFGVQLGGYNGLTGIPMLQIGNHAFSQVGYYFLTFCIMLAIYFSLRILVKTNSGYKLAAVRENRDRSELFGYNVHFIQMIAFGISCGIAALSGVLYSAWGSYIAPDNLSMTQSTIPVVIVASGGRKNPTATILFSILYYVLSSKLAASGSQWNYIIIGVVLIVVLLFIPEGLFSALFKKIDGLVLKNREAAHE